MRLFYVEYVLSSDLLSPCLSSLLFPEPSFLTSAQDRSAKITLSQVKKGIPIFSHMPMALPEGVRKEMEEVIKAYQIS